MHLFQRVFIFYNAMESSTVEFADTNAAIVRSEKRIVNFDGLETDIDLMSADELESLVNELRFLKENPNKLKGQLSSLTGKSGFGLK